MSFTQIKDQDVPVRLLRTMLNRKRIPHGLMFWGAGGIGKRFTALQLTKAIYCKEAPDDACDACLACRKVTNGNHPDIKIVEPVKRSRNINVETVEEMNEMASLRPFEAQRRIFIIIDADRMQAPAQNHFLKTLEEPPGNSLFILVTEYPRLLLPTIRSRCQMVRFRNLKPQSIKELLLEQRDLSASQAESVASLAQGQMSRANDLIDSDRRDVVLDIVERLNKGEDPMEVAEGFTRYLKSRKDEIETIVNDELGIDAEDGISPEDKAHLKEQRMAELNARVERETMEYLYLFQTWYRDELVFAATQSVDKVLNFDKTNLMKKTDTDKSQDKILAINEARLYLGRFINEERVFRNLFLTLAQ